MRASTPRLRGDTGAVGGVETWPFGIAVLLGAALLLANVWAVVDAKMAASSAARETVRVWVESDGDTVGATAAGHAAYAAYGRDPARLEGPDLSIDGDGFERCARVSATWTATVPALTLPLVGAWGDGFQVTSTHSEIVDPYRSGLPAEGGCR